MPSYIFVDQAENVVISGHHLGFDGVLTTSSDSYQSLYGPPFRGSVSINVEIKKHYIRAKFRAGRAESVVADFTDFSSASVHFAPHSSFPDECVKSQILPAGISVCACSGWQLRGCWGGVCA